MKTMFRQNMGIIDRGFRICVGITLLVLGITVVEGITGTILIILSVPLLVFGITGFCPAYILFGFSTKRKDSCC